MAGATIDHLISVTVFLGAILLFISLFNQTIQTAVLYQHHRALATKCSDLLDNILLNPGEWSGSIPTSFGLQDPEFKQYRLNPFSLMRLLSSAGDKVYYSRTGEWYSNVSWGVGGGYLLLQESECINYSTASKLLGVNGTYGFQLTVTPTLTINIRETQPNPLQLEIQVLGPGQPLSNATLSYLMFTVNSTKGGTCIGGNATTSSLGLASLTFSGIRVDNNQTAYTFIVKANVGGLYGVGYLSREIITKAGNIIPFVESYDDGTILLAHKWGKNDPGNQSQANLFYNATFYILSESFTYITVDVGENSTGHVNYGEGWPYRVVQIPLEARNNLGFLIVTFWTGNDYGMVIMPWGIGTVGVSVVFGGDPKNQEWVATDMRQVIVGDVSYQATLALWSLKGYPVVDYK